jgi:hypothetical protein
MKDAETWCNELNLPHSFDAIRDIQIDAVIATENAIADALQPVLGHRIRSLAPSPPVEHKKCPRCGHGGRVRISESGLCQIVCAGSFPCMQTAFQATEAEVWAIWDARTRDHD